MRSGLKTILVITVVIGAAAVLVWAFVQGRKELAMEQERERPIKAPVRVFTENGESVVKLDLDTQEKSGIAVNSLKVISRQEELKAYGVVVELQPLVELRNSFATAQAQVEKAQASLEASRKEYERLKTLRENQNVSVKVFQAAEAAWRSDSASERSAEVALEAIRATVGQQWGAVIGKWLFEGSGEFERLMQRQDVLLKITLPPATRLTSAPRNARVQTQEGKFRSANLLSPAPSTDQRIQGMSFFYVAQAPSADLLPGMNVFAYLPNGSETKGIVVPATAVVFWQGKTWIYVQKDSDRFVRHEIPTDTPVDDGWFVTRGLSPNDRIVTRGAQLLLSEELRSQIQIAE